MKKKGLYIIMAVILLCNISVHNLSVYANEIYAPIEGYENRMGVYYKLDETRFRINFRMDQKEFYLEKGEYFSIPWQSGYFDSDITYYVSNPSVCSVTSDGMVTALDTGETDITIVCGDNAVVVVIHIYVMPTHRSSTNQYKSVVKAINKVYNKYGKEGSITSKNYEIAWKEILQADKKLKSYCEYVESFYGLDADTQNAFYESLLGVDKMWNYYNALGSTLEQIVEGTLHNDLCGWGDEFCMKNLLCVDIWKLEVVVNNLSSYTAKINPYDTNNADAFQIKSIKQDKKTSDLIVKLEQKVTKKQMYGSYLNPKYFTREPLKWTSLLQANTSLKTIPCIVRLIKHDGAIEDVFVGSYELGKDTFRVKAKNEGDAKKKLKKGQYKVILEPIINDIFYDEKCSEEIYNDPSDYPIAIVQKVIIK